MKMIADLLREKGVSEEEIIFLNLELYENRRLLDLDELLVSSEVINREYRSLLEIRDAYPKMVLFMDKVPIDTRDGIRHKNIIDFLPEE